MKIRTLQELQDALDADLSWRKKELIDMRMLVRTTQNPMLIRAGVALLSAHFEGFLRQSANYYIIYVSYKKKVTSQLKDSFLALKCKSKITGCANTEKTSVHIGLITSLATEASETFFLRYSPSDPIIKTDSNPTSNVFEEIMLSLSLDFSPYETKRNYIDADLLNNRNQIVHGERCILTESDYDNTYLRISEIMDCLKDQIMAAATDGKYLK